MTTSIGLDIGSSAVRAAQVRTGGQGPAVLERIGQVTLPAGAVRDGEILDPDPVVDALCQLWSHFDLKGRKVALGVANQQVVVREVDLPYMPEKDLRAALPFQVQELIPIPIEQAILDMHVLENYENDDGRRFSRVLLVAAQRQMVEGLVAVTRKAKLRPVLVDLDAFAVLRSLAPAAFLDDDGGEIVLHIGSSVTNIVVHTGGIPRFARMLMMGGGVITETLVGTLGMTADEAETAKAVTGLLDEDAMDDDDRAARIIADRAVRFIDEIRSSLDYFASQANAVDVRRGILSGGGGQLPNLADRLTDALGIPFERGHPMQELHTRGTGLATDELVAAEPFLAVAVGLAMGAAE